ncbi:PKD domain-containing protein [Zobellia alginiliquefaciens]|uniref:PKD domain-containing protein n=1 Tax=Zobellia alginiliquefaciens TaxID=3032586 RepID=UPI0023E3E9E3|nr:PKD domain-containing protein [Zobellia alginiliquefaciens]
MYKENIFKKIKLLLLGIVTTGSFISCDDSLFRDDLPDANSKVDTVFPEANFDYTADQENFKVINFTDLSSEASTYAWDFGGGATSTEQDPTHTFDGEGVYPVTFTASDGNNESSSITIDVVVEDKLVSAFECADFNCDPRTPWGGGRGTSTYSGSSSPTPPEGNGGAKISSSSQFLDQTILVLPGRTYEITFWYVSKSSGTSAGTLLIEDADNPDEPAFLNQEIPLSSTASSYEPISFRVETGDATENMRFNIEYAGTESRFSKISIEQIE